MSKIDVFANIIASTNNYEVIYVIKTVMKYHLRKIDTSFHQPLPNMAQRLFADVIHDAILFMNIHDHDHVSEWGDMSIRGLLFQ
jgi:hypothetical protein